MVVATMFHGFMLWQVWLLPQCFMVYAMAGHVCCHSVSWFSAMAGHVRCHIVAWFYDMPGHVLGVTVYHGFMLWQAMFVVTMFMVSWYGSPCFGCHNVHGFMLWQAMIVAVVLTGLLPIQGWVPWFLLPACVHAPLWAWIESRTTQPSPSPPPRLPPSPPPRW